MLKCKIVMQPFFNKKHLNNCYEVDITLIAVREGNKIQYLQYRTVKKIFF